MGSLPKQDVGTVDKKLSYCFELIKNQRDNKALVNKTSFYLFTILLTVRPNQFKLLVIPVSNRSHLPRAQLYPNFADV